MSFNYNEELLDMLLKQVLGTKYTSSRLVFGQELPTLTRYQTNTVYAKELPLSTESNFEWSTPTNITDGGTFKILNTVFGEINPSAYNFIKKYEDIPMINIPGTNGRAWYPLNKELRKTLQNTIIGKTNLTFEIETNILYDEQIYSNNPNYFPIINSGVLLFMGNLIPEITDIVKLKRVYIYDGEYGAAKGFGLDGLADVLLIEPLDIQPLVYNSASSQWNGGSIGINFMPIQKLGDFLEINDEFIGINSGIFYSTATNKWDMGNLPIIISDLSNVYFSEIDTNWNGVVWQSDANGDRWVNNGLQKPITSINDLPDVDILSSTLVNNDGIIYDSIYNLWMPNVIQLSMSLATISDVNLTNIADNHRLKYDAEADTWNTDIIGPSINILDDIGNVDMSNLDDIIPKWIKADRLKLATPIENSYFGNSVDINEEFVIIGAYKEQNASSTPILTNSGKVYIYQLGETNILYETIIPSDESSESLFGSVVKIDNEKVIITAPNQNTNKGKVYIYNYTNNYYGTSVGSYYEESLSLIATNEISNNHFGSSIATYGDYIIIGANQNSLVTGKGLAYMFKKNVNVWEQIKILEAPTSGSYIGEVGDQFGDTVDINNDFAFIGVPKKNSNKGLVHVYKKNELGNDNWGLKYTLKPSIWTNNSFFGKAIAVSNNHLFISSPSTEVSGIIYYYNYTDKWGIDNADIYNESNKLNPVNGSNNDQYGISISTTDKIMVAGASGVDIDGNDSGAIYIYRNTSLGFWEQTDKIASSDLLPGDEFGIAIGIQYKTVVIGAWKNGVSTDSNNPENSGSAYLYNLPEISAGSKLVIFDDNYHRWKAGEIDENGDGIIFVTRIEHFKNVDIELTDYPLLSNSTLIYKPTIDKWVPGNSNSVLTSIGDVSKVDITAVSNNHLLIYSGNENWTTAILDDPIDELNNILDVSAIIQSNDDGLFYNSTINKWESKLSDKSLAKSIYTSATEPNNTTPGDIYYDTNADLYFGKIENDWLQIMMSNNPIIFGHPTNAITNLQKVIIPYSLSPLVPSSITISWDNPNQIDTVFESIIETDKVDGILYLPTINNIFFEIKKETEDFNDVDAVNIGGQDVGQKLNSSSDIYMLTNKISIIDSNSDIIERDGTNQVYKMGHVLEAGITYKARLWLKNSSPADNDYKIFTSMLV